MENQLCHRCGRLLTADEIGLTRKLINRGTQELFCKTCLAEAFRISEDECDAMIKRFRESGCTLFT